MTSQAVNSSPGNTVQRALISVFDKTHLVSLGRGLHALGIELLASGGTAATLQDAGVPTVPIERFTGAPEVLDGRVKTLHPKIHAGILADRSNPAHLTELQKQQYVPIDLVICNLYPFAQYLAEGKARAALIEKIDIGGPTLLRAAAKNVEGGVCVVADPGDYEGVLAALAPACSLPPRLRRALAAKAFRIVADYDNAIAGWAMSQIDTDATSPASALPAMLQNFTKSDLLRYGENPHQQAALYRSSGDLNGIAAGTLLAGKELSYNNYLDMDAAYRAAGVLSVYGCAIIKHTNPCGLAQATSQLEAFERALAGDPVSAFGSVIGFNTALEVQTVHAMQAAKLFVECIAAPDFSSEALELLKKRENLRLFRTPVGDPCPTYQAHRIGGGLLVQQSDTADGTPTNWAVVTQKGLQTGWLEELVFANKAAMLLKSNAIAVSHGHALLGAGAGHMSRIDAAQQALKKAAAKARGAFLASDAFFPFADCVELAAAAGIAAIVQPGGSKRDQDSIDACNHAGICMVVTQRRHFRH